MDAQFKLMYGFSWKYYDLGKFVMRIWVCFLLLLIASPVIADDSFDPRLLPSTPVFQKKGGKLYTPGYYPQFYFHSPTSYNAGCSQPFTEKDGRIKQAYIAQEKTVIRNAWNFPEHHQGEAPILDLTVDRQGNLIEVKLLYSSGDPLMDTQAIEQIKKAFPLTPISPEYSADKVDFVISPIWLNPVKEEPKQSESEKAAIGEWIQSFQKLIRKNWHPPQVFSSKRTTVLMQIHVKTGRLLKTSIVTTSCNPDYDQHGLDAINASKEQIHPFPTFIHADFLDVLFTFDNSIEKYQPYKKGSLAK